MALAFVSVFGLATRLMALERRLASWEKSERLTPQRLAELAEVSEAVKRAEELLVKVNRREIARAKPRAEDGEFRPWANGSDKDALRRRAGLVAGQPAPHK